MCLIGVAFLAHAQFPLVIAANRDEAFARPAIAANFWEDHPAVIGGRDLLHGGSWLAMTRRGRWAAVTNLRGADRTAKSRSRGSLVTRFVTGDQEPAEYLAGVAADAGAYGGFHLLAASRRSLAYVSSADGVAEALAPGLHSFSNAQPGVEWAKVRAIREGMRRVLDLGTGAQMIAEELTALLTSPSAAALHRGSTAAEEIEEEAFIVGDRYGTRSSTIIVVEAVGTAYFVERTFGPGGKSIGSSSHEFNLG